VKPWRIAAAGLVSLGVAMGIGRFAFTPLLPMMLADGVLDLPTASWLASANYFGYLVGALLCTFQPWIWRRLGNPRAPRPTVLVRAGLVATTGFTLAMALHLPAAWPLLRFLAGVASALVFVYVSQWCLSRLAASGVPTMGALIYTGPGAGIVLSGLAASAMVALNRSAALGWLLFGLLAAALTALVWPVFQEHGRVAQAAGSPVPPSHPARGRSRSEMPLLALAYGLAGFGYIITATFLPVIARQALPGSAWLDLFWPIFGIGVIVGAALASRVRATANMRLLLAGCYAMQAVGVAASLVSPTLAGFALGSLLLGLPFTAITFFAMQEVRRLRPEQAPSFMGLLTAMYGLGQIVGPPLATALLSHGPAGSGFSRSLEIAVAALLLGVVLYLWLARHSHPGSTVR
jgi:predicted MFS family arabinose efflux permease